ELRTADAAPRVARVRRRGTERARLERLRQALPGARRRREAARLGAGPRRAARVAQRASDDRRLACSRLRALVWRLHGAGGARLPTRAGGRPPRGGPGAEAS